MKISIIAIGKIKKSSNLSELIEEYLKRTPWDIQIKEHAEKSYGSVETQKQKEAELLISSASKDSFKIALDENGSIICSEKFASKIGKWQNSGYGNFTFFLGGANGHGQNLLNQCDFKLSLGKMTLPHKLARVMLSEQIYRAYTILNNHPYHKK